MKMELNSSMPIPKAYSGRKFVRFVFLKKNRFNFSQIFCDFGKDFQVVDTNGENPLTQVVTEISHVCCFQKQRKKFFFVSQSG